MIKKGLHHRWKVQRCAAGCGKMFPSYFSVYPYSDQNIHLYTCHSKVATKPNQPLQHELLPHPFLYVSWSSFRFPSSIRISPAFKNCCKPLVLRPTLSLASKKGSLFRILSHRFFSKAVRWNLALGQGHLISFCTWRDCSWDYSIHWNYLVVIPLKYTMISLIPKPQFLVLRGILIW